MASKKQANRYWFPADFWDRPKSKERGDTGSDAAVKIYHAVGFALSTWEEVEHTLADLFILMMECRTGSKNEVAARRAYGSIDSNSGRRKIIEAVAEVYFFRAWSNPYLQKPTLELIKEVESAARRRDDIAHGRAVKNEKISIKGREHFGSFLFAANYHNTRSSAFPDFSDPLGHMRADYRYTSDDIVTIAKKFGELNFKIHEYSVLIQNKDDFSPLIKRGRPVPPPPKTTKD